MKPDFEKIAGDLSLRAYTRQQPDRLTELIAAQLALAYQEGICDGLRQSETAIKAAFDKYQGRVEP